MLKIDTRDVGKVRVVDLDGQIDGGPPSAELHEAIKRHLENGQKKYLLNLEKVGWVNSLGVGTLVAAYVSARRNEGDLKFCNATNRVSSVLKSCGVVPDIFEVYESEQSGLDSFA